MVLGFLIYESIDIAYNVSKIGYNSITGVYNWYYQVKNEEEEEKDRLSRLENKLDKITKLFEEEDLKNKIQQLNLKIKN